MFTKIALRKKKFGDEGELIMDEKQIEEMARDLFECLEYDEWSSREYGETEVDTDTTARNLINKGYRKIGQEEWISVKDKLPNLYEEVLIYRSYGIVNFEVYTYLGDNKWEDSMGYVDDTEEEFITHWQPLPTPPQVKGE
jgi:hypothetical protein